MKILRKIGNRIAYKVSNSLVKEDYTKDYLVNLDNSYKNMVAKSNQERKEKQHQKFDVVKRKFDGVRKSVKISDEIKFLKEVEFFDKNLKKYDKKLKGKNLLTRDFEASVLYVLVEGDYLRVNEAQEMPQEEQEETYVLLKTNHGTYAIEFHVEIQRDF